MQGPPVIKTALNFGALSGLGSFLVFLIIYALGFNPLGPSSWLGAWVPVVFMVWSSLYYRNRENGGYLIYWSGFRLSFLTASFSAFVFGALAWSFVSVIDGSILDHHKQELLSALELSEGLMKSMMGEVAFEQSIESITKMNMGDVVTSDIFNKILGGLLVVFIVAAFVKRDPVFKNTEEE